MSYKVIMIRSDQENNYIARKEYLTQIPMEIVSYLALIEKRDWTLFRDSSYNMFGEFVYRSLDRYPELKGYIHNNNYRFEFIYEFLTDQSKLLHSDYYHNDLPISESTYCIDTHRLNYTERWIMTDTCSFKTLIFFEYKHIYAEY